LQSQAKGEAAIPYRECDLVPGPGKIVFYLGDAGTILRNNIRKRSVDVVVTSPPYNLGKPYGPCRDRLPRDEYIDWIAEICSSVAGVLSEDGSFFLNLGQISRDQFLPLEIVLRLKKEFHLQNTIHWVKSISVQRRDAESGGTVTETVGHVKPLRSSRYLNDEHEYVFHLTLHGDVRIDKLAVGVPYKDKSNITRWRSAGSDLRDRGNVWHIPYRTIQSRRERPHPATFPVMLPEFCIKLHGLSKTRLVMDPFNGIGSTALACASLGMNYIGIDINSAYLDESFNAVNNLLKERRDRLH
jgi:site-specific DNA-methyltransferase (adenine-specific)